MRLTYNISYTLVFVFSLLILSTQSIHAQYTGVINSNRPGFSLSPYGVGTGVYQLESSWFIKRSEIVKTFTNPSFGGVDLFFRAGHFNEKLEFNLDIAYQKDKIAFKNIFTSHYYKTNFSRFTLGAKYLLYEREYKDKSKEIRSWKAKTKFDWNRLIPSIAIYGGIHLGVAAGVHKMGGFAPKVGLLLQNNINRDFNIISNIYYDRIGTDYAHFSYIVTGTYSFTDRWSTFIENQTLFEKHRVSSNLGSGIAYLYNRNLQLNSSLRLMAEGKSKGVYFSLGASYRIDKHEDELIELDERGNPIEEDVNLKDKGFLANIWGSITGIFKSKKKKTVVNANQNLSNKTVESIKKNINKDEQTILNDTLKFKKKNSIRTRPKRVRVRPSKYKPVKEDKKKKGGIFSAFKGKTTEEKEKARKEKQAKKEEKRKAKEKKKEDKKKKKEDTKKEDDN